MRSLNLSVVAGLILGVASVAGTVAAEGASTRYTVVNVAPNDVLNIRAGSGVTSPITNRIPYYGAGIQIQGEG